MNWLTFKSNRLLKMKVFLIDDHMMLLSGLIKILSTEDKIEVIGTATTAKEGLEKLARSNPDLLITDYNLPDEDGLSVVRKVKLNYPEVKIIVLSMHDEAHLVKEVLKEGVEGYILKKDSYKELISAIYAVEQDKIYLSSDINAMLVKSLHGSDDQKLLTEREREILRLIAKEYTNKNIAEELFISERTVETHRKNIFRKTGTNNLVGLIKYAYANNLI